MEDRCGLHVGTHQPFIRRHTEDPVTEQNSGHTEDPVTEQNSGTVTPICSVVRLQTTIINLNQEKTSPLNETQTRYLPNTYECCANASPPPPPSGRAVKQCLRL